VICENCNEREATVEVDVTWGDRLMRHLIVCEPCSTAFTHEHEELPEPEPGFRRSRFARSETE